MAAFLLAVSPSRIKTLVANGRLATIAQAGQRWILFSSVRKYAEAGERLKVVTSKPDASKADMAKPGASKLYVSKPVVSKPVVSKLAASKPAAFKSVVPKPARSQ